MPRTEFIATGFHVPARIVTNDDLARIMDTSDEWIMQRSGIKTRHWVSDGETGVSLAREAAGRALANAARTAQPGLRVLFTTGYTRNNEKLDQGVHFIAKPFNLTALAAKVREVLGDPQVEA